MHRREDRLTESEKTRKPAKRLQLYVNFLDFIHRLRALFRKCEFGLHEKHVSEAWILRPCTENMHRREDRLTESEKARKPAKRLQLYVNFLDFFNRLRALFRKCEFGLHEKHVFEA